jgi:protein-arginine kinase activator protein McsA
MSQEMFDRLTAVMAGLRSGDKFDETVFARQINESANRLVSTVHELQDAIRNTYPLPVCPKELKGYERIKWYRANDPTNEVYQNYIESIKKSQDKYLSKVGKMPKKRHEKVDPENIDEYKKARRREYNRKYWESLRQDKERYRSVMDNINSWYRTDRMVKTELERLSAIDINGLNV